MLCNSEKIRSFVLFHVSYVRIYVRECVRACARWRNTKGVIARSRAATRGSVVVLFKYLFNGERGGRKGVDRAKLVPAETLYRGGKCPRGVVRTFAGRTSAILGTRSAQPALYPSHCAFSLYLSFLSSPRFFFFLRYACIQWFERRGFSRHREKKKEKACCVSNGSLQSLLRGVVEIIDVAEERGRFYRGEDRERSWEMENILVYIIFHWRCDSILPDKLDE